RFAGAEDTFLADRSRWSPPSDASPTADEYSTSSRGRPPREKLLYKVGAWFYWFYARVFEPPAPSFESAEFYGAARRLEGSQIKAALGGTTGAATRVSASGQRSVTLYSARPVRRHCNAA